MQATSAKRKATTTTTATTTQTYTTTTTATTAATAKTKTTPKQQANDKEGRICGGKGSNTGRWYFKSTTFQKCARCFKTTKDCYFVINR